MRGEQKSSDVEKRRLAEKLAQLSAGALEGSGLDSAPPQPAVRAASYIRPRVNLSPEGPAQATPPLSTWQVRGAFAATGKDAHLTISAHSKQEAEDQARANGLLVESAERVGSMPKPSITQTQFDAPPQSHVQYATPVAFGPSAGGPLRTSGLGVASLVIGILVCLVTWIPLIGLLGVPFAVIGVVIAFAGILVSGLTKREGMGLPIAGLLTCLAGIALALLSPFLIAGGLAIAAASSAPFGSAPATIAPGGGLPVAIAPTAGRSVARNVDGSRTVNETLRFSIESVTASPSRELRITLKVMNVSTDRHVRLPTRWAGTIRLTDESGTTYRLRSTSITGVGSSVLAPSAMRQDELQFEAIRSGATALVMSIDAGFTGSPANVDFKIAAPR